MILSFHNCSVINECGKIADNVLNSAVQCSHPSASGWRGEASVSCIRKVQPLIGGGGRRRRRLGETPLETNLVV